MKAIVLLISIAICTNVSAQHRADNWYFGNRAGLNFSELNPVSIPNSQINLNGISAAISDEEGKVLFYTDGRTVWNRKNEAMPNGNGLSGLGDQAPSEISGSQCLIIPQPNNDSICFIFTAVPPDWYFKDTTLLGFRYSTVNLNKENGNGDVDRKNILLFKNTTRKMTAVRHGNGNDVWLMAHEIDNNNFLAYTVTANGISSLPVINSIGITIYGNNQVNNTAGFDEMGQMKFSPDGTKLAVVFPQSRKVQLFDFDNLTGKLGFIRTIDVHTPPFLYLFGVEFSPGSDLLYFTESNLGCGSNGSKIYQLQISDNSNQPTIVGEFLTATCVLQLGTDGRIYAANCTFPPSNNDYLAAIEFPTAIGKACQCSKKFINLVSGLSYSQSLPNFVQSYFQFEDPKIEMPNVFTPNSDSINSKFEPITMTNVHSASLKIVDRTGKEVFNSEQLDKGWDGGVCGRDIYYWLITYHGKNGKYGTLKGWVELLK